MNIKNAIEEEKLYVEERLNNQTGGSLIDRLSKYGYDSLSEYFEDKKDYLLKTTNFEFYTGDANGMLEIGREAFGSKTPYVFIPTLAKTSIWKGLDAMIDRKICYMLDIDVFDVGANGGVIVTSPEDLSLEILIPDNLDVDFNYFLERFYKFYKKYFDDVVIDNNDILINGVKVQGSGYIENNGMFMFLSHISFVDNSKIIGQVCIKTSDKQAGWIDSNVLTKEMLYQEVMSWL